MLSCSLPADACCALSALGPFMSIPLLIAPLYLSYNNISEREARLLYYFRKTESTKTVRRSDLQKPAFSLYLSPKAQ
jgi:hypothetical protein